MNHAGQKGKWWSINEILCCSDDVFSLLSNIKSLDYDGVLMISLKVSLEECGMQP